MSKSRVFIALAISFAAGVWLASRFHIPGEWIGAALLAGIAAFALTFNGRQKIAPVAAACICMAALGCARLQLSLHQNEYAGMFDSKQQLEGFIVEDPDLRQTNQFITVQPKGFSQRVLVTERLTADYFYGQWVVISGKVEQPENFDDFDYQKYLERFNVYAVMKYPQLLVLKDHRQNFVKELLLRVKHAFIARASGFLPEPQSSLLMGILIGARKTLPQDVVNNFNATGTSHIIAISGYNITVIMSSLAFLGAYLSRRWRLIATLLLISAFVVLSGASASVVRAAIMGGLVLLAGNVGRQYSVGPSLFFAGLVMLVVNPRILFWDASFQLSFLATLGIVYFQPLLEQLTAGWANPLGVKSILLTTMSAITATLPLILLTFGRLSVVAPLVNILILPIVPLTMLLGFLTVLPFFGSGCAFAASLFLRYILNTTASFAHVPYGSFLIKISGGVFALLAAGVVAAFVLLRQLAGRRSKAKIAGKTPV